MYGFKKKCFGKEKCLFIKIFNENLKKNVFDMFVCK